MQEVGENSLFVLLSRFTWVILIDVTLKQILRMNLGKWENGRRLLPRSVQGRVGLGLRKG